MSQSIAKKIVSLEAELNKNRDDIDTQLELGKLYFINSEYDKAIEMYRRILVHDATNISAYYNLGMAYEARKMNEQAKQMFRMILELDPANETAQEALDKLVDINLEEV